MRKAPVMRRPALLVAVSIALALVIPQAVFATCGAEGCPCVRRGLADNGGRYAFDLRTLDVQQDHLWSDRGPVALESALLGSASHHAIPLMTHTRSWSLEGRMKLTERLKLSASLPYMDRSHRRYEAHSTVFTKDFVQSWHYQGLGDATTFLTYQAYEPFGGPRVNVRAGAKLPTGRRHVALGDGLIPVEPQPTLRPGTGSLDLIAGVNLSQRMPWQPVLPLGLDVQRRWNGKGTEDYRAGAELQASVSSGWAAKPWLTFTALANYASHGSDSWTAPTASDPYREPAHASARTLYVTPGANVALGHGVTFYAAWQNRVWGRSEQAMVVAKNYLLLGTSFSLGQ